MVKVSLRNLVTNKLRLFLTVMAVTVGVAFVSGTFVLKDTMVKAFDEMFEGITAKTDVVVKTEVAYDADITATGGQVRPMGENIVTEIRRLDGVEVAEGSVSGFALVLDQNGEPIQNAGAPTFGVSITDDPDLAGGLTFDEGRAPIGPQQIALDETTADAGDYQVGDDVDVVLQGGRRTFTLVGIMGYDETQSLLGATLTAFDLRTAQEVFDKVGLVDEVDIRGEPGVSATVLRDRIAAVLPEGIQALTGAQVADQGTDDVQDALGIFTTVLLVFAGVSLLVGALVIWNSFNVVVAQRRREVALLRAVGATRRQVLGGVIIEAAAIGLVAGGLGLVVGIGLAAGIRSLLSFFGLELPTTSPTVELRTVVVAFAVGVLVTIAAAVAPAWSSTRVAPMEALRSVVPASGSVGRLRRTAGWVLTGSGLVVLAICTAVANQRWWTVVGTVATFVGLVVLGPTLAGAAARLVDHGRRGSGWRMAARNIARNSRRSAATALALTVGLTVVVAVAVTSESLKESVSDAVSTGNRSDLILEPAGMGYGMSPSVAALLRDREDVAEVVQFREAPARVNKRDSLVTGLDTDGLDQVIDLGIESGSVDALRRGTVLVSTTEADDLGVDIGDEVTVTFPETGTTTMEVVGTFSKGSLINASYVVHLADLADNVTSQLDAAVFVNAAPGTDPAEFEDTIEAAVADYPNVEVNDPDDITEQAQSSVNQLLGIVTALLLLAVVVAILGIVNTLMLSVVERTRELGMLRAIGSTRRQVRAVVRRESVLMSVLGAVVGLGLGTASGVALSRALEDEGITAVAVPGATLVVYLVIAAAVGVLAAIGPARRASRVDILDAVTAE